MRDLVQHDVPDLPAQHLRVPAVEPLERPAVDRDLVRQRAAVAAPSSRERNALIEAKERLPPRRLVLDDDLDVGDAVARSRGSESSASCTTWSKSGVALSSTS
jgi:hypothetical protein